MHHMTKRHDRMSPVTRGFWDTDFFDNFFDNDVATLPAVNVMEKDKEYSVDVSLPGFDKKDINIEIDKNELKVSAKIENKIEEKDDKDRIVRREFSASSFERRFILPENIDTDAIVAKQENGVLAITLPKKQDAKEDAVKKITVA